MVECCQYMVSQKENVLRTHPGMSAEAKGTGVGTDALPDVLLMGCFHQTGRHKE